MIDLLLLLIKPALRYVDDKSTPWWRLDLAACAVAGAILDVLIAHTTWAGFAGFPQKGEWTISHTLERLCNPANKDHPDYSLFVEIGRKINLMSPGHIKILKGYTQGN